MYDLVVTGGTVVSASSETPLDVAVDGEKIAATGPVGSLGEAKRTVQADGCFVMPGGIDPHIHYGLEFPGLFTIESQDYSFAAAHGGNTSVIDFVFQLPPQSLGDAIAEKRAQSDGRMAVDYGLHAALTGDISFEVMDEIGDAIRGGIPTIKTLMTYAGLFMSDDGHRWGVMNKVAEAGGMSVVHAEDDAILSWLTKKYVREGKTHGAYICETRGPLVEEAAIRRAMLLAERSGSPLYVLHMAAESGILALNEGRAKGLPFYGETLLAYVSFCQDDMWDDTPFEAGGRTFPQRGLLYNNNPAPKFKEDKHACLAAIADDRLQAVGTDHCTVSVEDRYDIFGTTVEAMQAGQAAVELRLPVLFELGVNGGRFNVNRFVELVSTNPAKLMGMWPQKGQIAVGSDADILVFDPNKKWTVPPRRPPHERDVQLLGRLGAHGQAALDHPPRRGACRERELRRVEDRWTLRASHAAPRSCQQPARLRADVRVPTGCGDGLTGFSSAAHTPATPASKDDELDG